MVGHPLGRPTSARYGYTAGYANLPKPWPGLDAAAAAGDALPTFAVSGNIGIVDALIGLGFAASKGEARRLIKGGGARIGANKVSDETMTIDIGDEPIRLSAGKKHHGLLVRG